MQASRGLDKCGERSYSRYRYCHGGEDSWKEFPTFRFEMKSPAVCNLLFAKLLPVLRVSPGRCGQRQTEATQDKGPGSWESSGRVHKSYGGSVIAIVKAVDDRACIVWRRNVRGGSHIKCNFGQCPGVEVLVPRHNSDEVELPDEKWVWRKVDCVEGDELGRTKSTRRTGAACILHATTVSDATTCYRRTLLACGQQYEAVSPLFSAFRPLLLLHHQCYQRHQRQPHISNSV